MGAEARSNASVLKGDAAEMGSEKQCVQGILATIPQHTSEHVVFCGVTTGREDHEVQRTNEEQTMGRVHAEHVLELTVSLPSHPGGNPNSSRTTLQTPVGWSSPSVNTLQQTSAVRSRHDMALGDPGTDGCANGCGLVSGAEDLRCAAPAKRRRSPPATERSPDIQERESSQVHRPLCSIRSREVSNWRSNHEGSIDDNGGRRSPMDRTQQRDWSESIGSRSSRPAMPPKRGTATHGRPGIESGRALGVLKTLNAENVDEVLGSRRMHCPHRDTAKRREHCNARTPGHWIAGHLWRPTKVARSAEDMKLPLYAKGVRILDFNRANDIVKSNSSTEDWSTWKNLCGMFTTQWGTCNVFQELEEKTTELGEALSDDDIEMLVAKGLLRPSSANECKHFCSTFSVVESEKGRRRWILWPKEINEKDDLTVEGVTFPTLHQQVKQAQAAWGAAIDFTAFFQQFPIEHELQKHFCLLIRGKYFCATTFPTGGRRPPWIAQMLSRAILKEAAVRAGLAQHFALHPEDLEAYMDNLRITGTWSIVQSTMTEVRNVCDEIGITIAESSEESQPRLSYAFLGVQYNHDEHTVSLTPKTKGKLKEAMMVINGTTTTVLWRDIQASLGICFWTAIITKSPLCDIYPIIKFARRRASQFAGQASNSSVHTTVWPSIISLWSAWIQSMMDANPTKQCSTERTTECTLFTDASLSGYGAVMIVEGTMDVVAGPWRQGKSKQDHINILEVRAVRLALSSFALQRGTSIHLFIDNTSAMYNLRKERSKSFHTNAEIQKIRDIMKIKHLTFAGIEYVKSELNPADGPSRISWNHLRR